MMHNATHSEIEAFLNTPGSIASTVLSVKRIQLTPMIQLQREQLLIRQREHWRKLHTTRFTPEEFEAWIRSIPGCSSCQRDFRKLLETHPPRFNDWWQWTWEIHNAVNAKLGKSALPWQEACNLYSWQCR
jgi:hypothetical protein